MPAVKIRGSNTEVSEEEILTETISRLTLEHLETTNELVINGQQQQMAKTGAYPLVGVVLLCKVIDGKKEYSLESGEPTKEQAEVLQKMSGAANPDALYPTHAVSVGDKWSLGKEGVCILLREKADNVLTGTCDLTFVSTITLSGRKCGQLNVTLAAHLRKTDNDGTTGEEKCNLSGEIYRDMDSYFDVRSRLQGTTSLNGPDGQFAGTLQFNKDTILARKHPQFDVLRVKEKAAAFKEKTLVFKGFYLGMPIADALALFNCYMGLKQTSATPIHDDSSMSAAKEGSDPVKAAGALMLQSLVSPLQGMTPAQLKALGVDDHTIVALGITDPNAPYRVYSREGVTCIAKAPSDRPVAVANTSGQIISFELCRPVLNKLFDAGGMPTREFLQTFVNAYDLTELKPDRHTITATIMGITKEIGFQTIYRHRSTKGYEVIYYADSVILEDGMETFADTPPEGTMTIKKIETAKQRESKFD